jgi:hypothetical protein
MLEPGVNVRLGEGGGAGGVWGSKIYESRGSMILRIDFVES